jgi:hypothetical protein
LAYQSALFAPPEISGTPLLIASVSKALITLSEPTRMATTLSWSISFFSTDCAVAGLPASSTVMICTGWPSMPPLALTHSAQAGATVALWLLLEACEPLSDAMLPILMTDPFGAFAAALVDPPAELWLSPPVLLPLLLLQADRASAAAAASETPPIRARRLVMLTIPWPLISSTCWD